MDIKVRIWAQNNEFPEGKMFYPDTMHDEVDEKRGFFLNQSGDVLHGVHRSPYMYEWALVWARVGFNGVTKMLSSGMKRNDRDVYVGDIVTYVYGDGERKNGAIVWKKRTGVVAYDEGCFTVDGTLLKDIIDNVEVIGNIKETPELVGMEV